MNRFRLRFPARELPDWAARFPVTAGDEAAQTSGARAAERGYFQRDEFLRLCRWKSPRSRRHFESNDQAFIRSTTAAALSTSDERLRIEVLTLLAGVDWPTASVILHFGHPDPYPVLDWRALWSLGVAKPPSYDFHLWWAYTRACRDLARRHRCSMRTIDRALWQYSRERQRAGSR